MPELDYAPPETSDLHRPRDLDGTDRGLFQQPTWKSRPATILALLLLVHAGWLLWGSATNMPGIDFFTFWSVPHVLSHRPIANIYSVGGQRDLAAAAVIEAQSPDVPDSQRKATAIVTQLYGGRMEVTATPMLYATIGWFSSGNFETDQKWFVFVCTLCLALSLAVLKNLLRFSLLEILLLAIFVASYYVPVLTNAGVLDINEILLFGTVLFILFSARSRPLLAGLAIGTTTMLKPTTAMVLALSMIAAITDRERRQLLRMLAGSLIAAAASCLASAAYFRSPAIWLDFFRSVPGTLNGIPDSLRNGNFSLPALLFGETSGKAMVIPVFFLVVLSWLLLTTRRNGARRSYGEFSKQADESRRLQTAFVVGGGGCAVMLLSSPLVWPHHYLLLLPLSLYVLRPVSENKRAFSVADVGIQRMAVLVLPFVLLLMFSYLAEQIVGNDVRILRVLFNVVTVSTLALASYRIWQERETSAGSMAIQKASS